MQSLYPFKFTPVFKEKIWGGQKIKEILNLKVDEIPNCGEVWLVSGVPDNPTIVSNGYLAGNELNELVEVFMGDLVGDKVYDQFGDIFPILIKIIDSNDWLSVQVHPDDALAAKRNIGSGKTEMWYILQSDETGQLISGFNRPMTEEIYVKHLNDKQIKDILNFEKVEKDDVFFIPAGKIHALGPGLLLAEIQQTSDTTYRVYDWDRIDHKGMSRELHTEEALEAIDYKYVAEHKTKFAVKQNGTAPIVNSEFFTTNIIELSLPLRKDYSDTDSFVILMCIEGSCELKWDGEPIKMNISDTIIVPNIIDKIALHPHTNCKLLEVYIA
ncbi:MAG: class I mannose-6-phosphate isomerase [Bacteroidales bacterium]|nr:class I mannose-6-phosphate isomerase [Bacteroidales bacterium]